MSSWKDVVFIGDYEGKKFSEVLAEWAEENEVHNNETDRDHCTCDFCQVFIPMAHKLETPQPNNANQLELKSGAVIGNQKQSN